MLSAAGWRETHPFMSSALIGSSVFSETPIPPSSSFLPSEFSFLPQSPALASRRPCSDISRGHYSCSSPVTVCHHSVGRQSECCHHGALHTRRRVQHVCIRSDDPCPVQHRNSSSPLHQQDPAASQRLECDMATAHASSCKTVKHWPGHPDLGGFYSASASGHPAQPRAIPGPDGSLLHFLPTAEFP